MDYTLHANANKHGQDVVLRVTLDWYDSEGTGGPSKTFRGHETVPLFDSTVDQAYVLLITMAKMLEKQGATGRLSVPDVGTLF